MKILQFIVVEENLRDGLCIHTVTGECYIPCESLVPVINKGKGCIGLAIVKKLLITHDSTQIEFELERGISKEKKTAYYDLYRNHASNVVTDDPYDNADQIIPGAMVGVGKPSKRREKGLSDRIGDYDYL